jgi:8-oxo-dGTP pyrophosphatase MutT (NUDIX family)
MAKVKKRRRGTAIVETEEGILVTAGRNRIFLLPGGGANRHETRVEAAMRELREETGLKPYCAKYLFRHRGRVSRSHGHGYFQDHHTVCLIKAHGTPSPRHEIKYVDYYKPGSGVHISGVTREIIERYYAYRKRNRAKQKLFSVFNRILEWLTT